MPAYRRLWIGGVFVFVSVMAQGIARAWLARELTGTNTGLGGVMLAFGLPMLVATPWGGVAADRLSKRAVLAVSATLLATTSGAVGVAVAFDVIEYWMLLVASGMQAVAFALYGPARMAFITELVDSRTLGNAIVLGQMSAEGSRVAGPAIAGAVIGSAAWGTEAVLIGGAGVMLVGIATLAALPPGRPPAARPVRSPLAELKDGVRYVRVHAALRLLVLTSLAVVMIAFPYLAFLPTVAEELFVVGSGGYGIMSAVGAGGAVVAGFAAARRGSTHDAWKTQYVAGFAVAAALGALALAPTYALALVALAALGGAGLTFQTTNQALLLELADFEYHGRIQSLVMLGFSGFGIAALPLGAVADAVGLRTTFAGMGAVVALCMAVSLRRSVSARRRPTPRDFA